MRCPHGGIEWLCRKCREAKKSASVAVEDSDSGSYYAPDTGVMDSAPAHATCDSVDSGSDAGASSSDGGGGDCSLG